MPNDIVYIAEKAYLCNKGKKDTDEQNFPHSD
jgi:hypothetical protein